MAITSVDMFRVDVFGDREVGEDYGEVMVMRTCSMMIQIGWNWRPRTKTQEVRIKNRSSGSMNSIRDVIYVK